MSEDHRSRLLLFRLHRHKAHRWPGGRLGDRFGISGVVLLATHKRLDVNRWNESNVVPETADRPSQRVEAAAARALDIGARTYGSVKSILDNNLDRHTAQQRSADGVTILHPNIRGSRYYH